MAQQDCGVDRLTGRPEMAPELPEVPINFDDPIVPLSNAKILAARIPHATLYMIDDGHLFLITRAREVGPVVRKFLRAEDG